MEAVRSTWSDSRLDDLNDRVDGVRNDVQALRGEIQAEFRHVRGEVSGLKRTIMQIGGGLIGTLAIGILGLIGTQL